MTGRPLTKGEKRPNKITINVSDSMFEDIQDLSNFHGKTTAIYIVDLISNDIEAQRKKINAFRELRQSDGD